MRLLTVAGVIVLAVLCVMAACLALVAKMIEWPVRRAMAAWSRLRTARP